MLPAPQTQLRLYNDLTDHPLHFVQGANIPVGARRSERLYAVIVWEETPFFTERERAALAWTEAVTLVGQGHVPDDVYLQARGSFSETELVNLTMAVIVINGWNRLAISFRTVPGTYQPARKNNVKTGAPDSPVQKEKEED